jgi:hypothetical protein
LKIIAKDEIEITPIETATETIETKTMSMRTELSKATKNVMAIQMALQGTLLTRNHNNIEILVFFSAEKSVSQR